MQTALSGGDPQPGPMARANGGPGGAGGPGGPAGASVSQSLVDYLVANQGGARWIVAANGSMVAASIQLAAQEPVMTMGGFTGADPAPSLGQLKAAIASGELRYVLVGGQGRPGGGPGTGPDGGFGGFGGGGLDGGFPGGPGGGNASSLNAWVTSSCTAVTIDGAATSLYDCAGATG